MAWCSRTCCPWVGELIRQAHLLAASAPARPRKSTASTPRRTPRLAPATATVTSTCPSSSRRTTRAILHSVRARPSIARSRATLERAQPTPPPTPSSCREIMRPRLRKRKSGARASDTLLRPRPSPTRCTERRPLLGRPPCSDFSGSRRPSTLDSPPRQRQTSSVVLPRSAVFIVVSSLVSTACGSSTSPDPSAACDVLFNHLIDGLGNCYGRLPSSDALAAQRERYREQCLHAMSYPGSGVTAETLSACADGQSGSCRGSPGAQVACTPRGSLSVGAACNLGAQCESGVCLGVSSDPCGACVAAVAVGAPCSPSGAPCAPDSECLGGVCVGFGTLPMGSPCRDDSACQRGLTCSVGGCAPLGAQFALCSASAQCQAGLYCINAHCIPQPADGLDCSGNCGFWQTCDRATTTCATITYSRQPGEPCSPVQECATAAIYGTGLCAITDPMHLTGVCPTVVPDGQHCVASDGTKTCDYWSTCEVGTCALSQPVCR
jgi:hypothetical protein